MDANLRTLSRRRLAELCCAAALAGAFPWQGALATPGQSDAANAVAPETPAHMSRAERQAARERRREERLQASFRDLARHREEISAKYDRTSGDYYAYMRAAEHWEAYLRAGRVLQIHLAEPPVSVNRPVALARADGFPSPFTDRHLRGLSRALPGEHLWMVGMKASPLANAQIAAYVEEEFAFKARRQQQNDRLGRPTTQRVEAERCIRQMLLRFSLGPEEVEPWLVAVRERAQGMTRAMSVSQPSLQAVFFENQGAGFGYVLQPFQSGGGAHAVLITAPSVWQAVTWAWEATAELAPPNSPTQN